MIGSKIWEMVGRKDIVAIGIIVYSLAAAFATWYYVTSNAFYPKPPGRSSIAGLHYEFGDVAEAIAETGSTKRRVDYEIFDQFDSYATHMPLIPLFLSLFVDPDRGLLPVFLCKALLAAAFLIAIVQRAMPRRDDLALAFIVSLATLGLFPRHILILFDVTFAEAYVVFFVSFAFSLVLFGPTPVTAGQSIPMIVSSAAIYLTKGASGGLAFLFPIFQAWRTRSPWLKISAMSGVAVAVVGWGLYNVVHGNGFQIGASHDTLALYLGNNPMTVEIYPSGDTDRTWTFIVAEAKGVVARNEIEAKEYFARRTVSFWTEHSAAAIRLFVDKAFVMFFEVRRIPLIGESFVSGPGDVANIAYMVAFRIVFWLAIWRALADLLGSRGSKQQRHGALLFLFFVAAYSAPYVIGFAQTRHVLVLPLPTLLWWTWRLREQFGDIQPEPRA
ncbi:MAG: hypothetical protein FJX46_12775 [Alphaproteobacteria bacterium]|nr:hypothetical protein [Alphaproteobacteria bacterium]